MHIAVTLEVTIELLWMGQTAFLALHNAVQGKTVTVAWQSMFGKGCSPGSNLAQAQSAFSTQMVHVYKVGTLSISLCCHK